MKIVTVEGAKKDNILEALSKNYDGDSNALPFVQGNTRLLILEKLIN